MKVDGADPKNRHAGCCVRVRNLQRRMSVDGRGLRAFLLRLAAELGLTDASATLVLVGDRRMQALNRIFRGVDRPTDVLAFSAGPSLLPEDDTYLGDIVISVDTAERRARPDQSGFYRELRVLALHGYLHLLGYDHETDDGEMRRIEYRLRRRFGITRQSRVADLGAGPVRRTKKK